MSNIEKHYDQVSNAWQYIMGDSQHYGLYKTGKENLNLASQNLIDEMLIGHSINHGSNILDVGC